MICYDGALAVPCYAEVCIADDVYISYYLQVYLGSAQTDRYVF